MKTLLTSAACITMLAAVPAAAQTMPLIIVTSTGDRVTPQSNLSFDDRITIAVEAACEKPFIRDLKGQELYQACLTEARAEVQANLAEAATVELARR